MQEYIKKLLAYQMLTVKEIEDICTQAIDILILEPNIRHVSSPLIVVGDIHGQFSDLLTLLGLKGFPDKMSYVFLGDYVDRGKYSLECILLLLAFKVQFPGHVTMVRGNHEQKAINSTYGLYDEIMAKFDSDKVWHTLNEVFRHLNVGAIVDQRYLCVHGGISSKTTVDRLQRLDRFENVEDNSLFADVIWSDPYNTIGQIASPRGNGVLFGEDILKHFLVTNNLEMVIRSHQLALSGYKWDFENRVLTVWSAPDYMGKCNNPATVLFIEKDKEITQNQILLFGRK